ncbi:hypothetical protein BO82DRAFT_17948 [Aspergillus uvarum CBS 121591]|uniref:Uncharacterized protein n=1 Tax=Aspergillus uvarum CBS 121591 TaxID=1448315 RepID=A0A319CJ30_9EURO|nr:hypothetical protein BO82DRAFT_17948 [Aspergillus uvarum CBS 121591]PYH84460.1 hypothetical protein BO82DRAFT_17948 [Aspergillus uvarum CBS 121591]
MQLSLYILAALSLGTTTTLAAPFPGTEVSAQSASTYHWHGCGSVGSCYSDGDCQVDENCLSMAQNENHPTACWAEWFE